MVLVGINATPLTGLYCKAARKVKILPWIASIDPPATHINRRTTDILYRYPLITLHLAHGTIKVDSKNPHFSRRWRYGIRWCRRGNSRSRGWDDWCIGVSRAGRN